MIFISLKTTIEVAWKKSKKKSSVFLDLSQPMIRAYVLKNSKATKINQKMKKKKKTKSPSSSAKESGCPHILQMVKDPKCC